MADDESRRAASRRHRRVAGDRSARIANALMKLSDPALANLDIGDELRAAIEDARRVTSPIARRRAERALAGELRRVDLGEIETSLANVEASGANDARLFHLAEQWRARLIAEDTAVAEFPGGAAEPLPTLIQNARREHDTGKPPGAKRALFRHVIKVLDEQR